jgi:DNA-binding beta-propeller fold protein YncE
MLAVGPARAEEPAEPLRLERTIELTDVAGRIDHLGIDLPRKHLFVAELGNVASGKSIDRISGLAKPQGIAYVQASDRIVVANGGDGTVRMFRGEDRAPSGAIDLGDDADNVRVDPRSAHVLVGYGDGGIAVIDPVSASKLADIELPVHPEGFQLAPDGRRIFVNLPDARQIAAIDLASGTQTASWSVPDLKANFPLAIDETGSLLATVFRSPPRLVLLDAQSGHVVANLDTCGDADDVFFDAHRKWIYISCGKGAVDVFQGDDASTHRLGRIGIPPGGRTARFVPELDRLFVAVRARLLRFEATIFEFRPVPGSARS